MTYTADAGYPDLTTIRAWIGVPATALDDPSLDQVAAAERQLQTQYLVWAEGADLPAPAYQSFLRRVARHVAAKGIPLGIIAADAEYGTVRVSRWDAEIDRLEAPYAIGAVVGPYA